MTKRLTLLFALLLLFASCQSQKEPENEVYMFSYFMGNGDGLHFAYSYDGLIWENLNDGAIFLLPEIGQTRLMRDPSIAQGKDGVFHLVWTSGWRDQGIGYSYSTDLLHWSPQQNLPVMAGYPGTVNTWAPEVYYDHSDDLFYIIWASTVPGAFDEIETSENEVGLNHRQYFVTTKDFKTFSDTELFFEPGFSVIDGAIVKKDGRYWFVLKNEESAPPEKNLRVTFTDDLKKGFPIEVSESISGDSWAEGPAPIQVGEYVYVYFDKYREHKYGAIRSSDGVTWEDVSDQVSFPEGVRHGTVFKVKESVLENMKAHDHSSH